MHPNPNTRRLMIERLVARCGPANRPGLERHVDQDKTNFELLSIKSWTQAVVKADGILGGKDFMQLTPGDVMRVVSAFRDIYAKPSLRLKAISFRKHIRYLHGVDDLEKSAFLAKGVGKAMEDILRVKREKPAVVGQVVADEDLEFLVAGVPVRYSRGPEFPMQDRDGMMWRVLRHSGFRIGEFVSLNRRYVTREVIDGRPCYRLDLVEAKHRTDGYTPDLKTGERTVYVADPKTVQALDDWLALHPSKDPDAPLSIKSHNGGRIERLNDDSVRKTLRICLKSAGLDAKYPGLTPHDFRHTCATEKAELGWGEYQVCLFFGWEIGSRTPGVYIHERLERQRARILADAHRQAQAVVQAAPQAGDAVSALLALVQQAAAQMRTPAPAASEPSGAASQLGAPVPNAEPSASAAA